MSFSTLKQQNYWFPKTASPWHGYFMCFTLQTSITQNSGKIWNCMENDVLSFKWARCSQHIKRWAILNKKWWNGGQFCLTRFECNSPFWNELPHLENPKHNNNLNYYYVTARLDWLHFFLFYKKVSLRFAKKQRNFWGSNMTIPIRKLRK